jgi:hypothetical protein
MRPDYEANKIEADNWYVEHGYAFPDFDDVVQDAINDGSYRLPTFGERYDTLTVDLVNPPARPQLYIEK